MEELRDMISSLEAADADKLIEDVPKIMEKIKEIGFLKVVQDDELKSFLPDLREKMADIDIEKLVPLAKVVMPSLFEGMGELFENSEEAKEELENMDDMSVQVAVPDLDVYMYVIVKGGKFTAGNGTIDNPELTLTMNKEAFIEQMQGKGSLVNAYMAGQVSLEGPINKAMALNTLFEVLADEYDMDIGLA